MGSRVIWLTHHYSPSHGQALDGRTREALCSSMYMLFSPDENILATLCPLEHKEQSNDLFSVTYMGYLECWLRSNLYYRPDHPFFF